MAEDAEGFAMVPRSIQRDETLSGHAKLVYLALSSRTNRAGQCWPSHRLIAAESSCSIASAKRALEELRARGYVTWTPRQTDATGQSSNLYTLHLHPQLTVTQGVAHHELGGSSHRATNETQVNETQENVSSHLEDHHNFVVPVRPLDGTQWRDLPVTEEQSELLHRAGYSKAQTPATRGEASDLIDHLRSQDLATREQWTYLLRLLDELGLDVYVLDGFDGRWPTKAQIAPWISDYRKQWFEAGLNEQANYA